MLPLPDSPFFNTSLTAKRLECGYSINKLSELTGIKARFIKAYELDKNDIELTRPRITNWFKLVKALGIVLSDEELRNANEYSYSRSYRDRGPMIDEQKVIITKLANMKGSFKPIKTYWYPSGLD